MMFIFHREYKNNKNMQFHMHNSRMNYFDQRNGCLTFLNTVSKNKEGFTVIQIKGVEADRDLCATLVYPSAKE